MSRGSFYARQWFLRFIWQAWVKFKLLWFNPFGAAALNHCSCCWHSSPQKPGSWWYKFICISTGENSGSLELQWEVFASVLNIFGEWAGVAPLSTLWEVLLCFSSWNKLSSRSCYLSEYTVGTFPFFFPHWHRPQPYLFKKCTSGSQIFINYLVLQWAWTWQVCSWAQGTWNSCGHPICAPSCLREPFRAGLGLQVKGNRKCSL